jgi:hypothetical protein
MMKAVVKRIKEGWTYGTVGDCMFEAKVFDAGSKYGIDGGKVSKLYIRSASKGEICNYDRGWDVKPTPENKAEYDAVMKLFK